MSSPSHIGKTPIDITSLANPLTEAVSFLHFISSHHPTGLNAREFSQLTQLLEQAERLAREISEETCGLVDNAQNWYWTEQWQAMEREEDDALATGEYCEFDSTEALLADLNARG